LRLPRRQSRAGDQPARVQRRHFDRVDSVRSAPKRAIAFAQIRARAGLARSPLLAAACRRYATCAFRLVGARGSLVLPRGSSGLGRAADREVRTCARPRIGAPRPTDADDRLTIHAASAGRSPATGIEALAQLGAHASFGDVVIVPIRLFAGRGGLLVSPSAATPYCSCHPCGAGRSPSFHASAAVRWQSGSWGGAVAGRCRHFRCCRSRVRPELCRWPLAAQPRVTSGRSDGCARNSVASIAKAIAPRVPWTPSAIAR